MIWNLSSCGVTCSYAPTSIRHSPDDSCSVTIPSPAGHDEGAGGSGGMVPPLVSRTPGSLIQVRSSVDTAENTCQPKQGKLPEEKNMRQPGPSARGTMLTFSVPLPCGAHVSSSRWRATPSYRNVMPSEETN